ncbi:tripartite tricarboxylate transporter substrate binding protein [Nocardioides sp. NPDC004968]|uniref:Bug family tripartite tricarboxylate transporter substrate binding protein n=1 Tax=Nocardioides sp. NPDC004968 TaxID=3155894 RepID=UPI0033A718C5
MTSQFSRRTFLAASTLSATFGLPSLAFSQGYPDKNKPIRALVPSSPGATTDVVARSFSQALAEVLKANVIVENRAGADGVIGMQAAKSAAPDGQTILFTSLSTMSMNPFLFKQLPYDPEKDFIPLAGTVKFGLILCVGTSVKEKTLQELMVKAKASPGKYTYASVSATTRLAGHMMAKAAGVELLNIPFKNYTDVMTNLISGKIDMFMTDVAGAQPFFSQGVRAIAATPAKRLPDMPDLPTLQENGIAGIDITGWHGAWLPAKTPAPIVDTLKSAFRDVWANKHVRELCEKKGMETLDLTGDDFAAFLRVESEKWGSAIREAGMANTI